MQYDLLHDFFLFFVIRQLIIVQIWKLNLTFDYIVNLNYLVLNLNLNYSI